LFFGLFVIVLKDFGRSAATGWRRWRAAGFEFGEICPALKPTICPLQASVKTVKTYPRIKMPCGWGKLEC
jgi:hypothetical protein